MLNETSSCVPSPDRRRSTTAPRRRAGDPSPRRRSGDRKKANSPLGAIATVAIASGFLAYVFNFQDFATTADTLFSNLNRSAQAQGDTIVPFVITALPFLSLLVVAFVVYLVARAMQRGMESKRKQRRLSDRHVITLEQFKELTAQHGIRPRIAAAAYELLLPFYSSSMRARLSDRLIDDLHMTQAQVHDMWGNLLRNTDRKEKVGDEANIHTVMDLLLWAQNASRQSLMNSTVRPAAARTSVIRPARRVTDSQPADTVAH
jgi:hypothetical protein